MKIIGKKKRKFERDPKGMRCPACKERGTLRAVCVVTFEAPIAKGGGLKMAGISVTHSVVKDAWEKQPKTIVCRNEECKEQFVYDGGLKHAA